MRLALPYNTFEEIQFNNDETLNFAYFNSHIRKLFDDFDAYEHVQKLPIASDRNYGLVRLASPDDIEKRTNSMSVLPVNAFQDFLRGMSEKQRRNYINDGELLLTKALTVSTGTITVPSGFYIGKTVTDRPSLVLFAHVSVEVPGMAKGGGAYSLDERRFTCCNVTETDAYPGASRVDLGKLWFDREDGDLSGTRHVQAYYKDGVVVVRNEAFADNAEVGTSSVNVRWTIVRKNA